MVGSAVDFGDWKCAAIFESLEDLTSVAKQVQDLLTILALREKGELSKRDCYRFDLDLLLQAENLRQAQGKEVNPQAITETYQSLTIHDKKEIQINGGILIKEYGYQPGPDLGEILTEIEYSIVDGELENDRQAIHAYLREKKWVILSLKN